MIMSQKQQQKPLEVKGSRPYSPQWAHDAHRLILYADFMGFKNRVLTREHNELKKELKEFHDKWYNKVSSLRLGGHLQFVQFSDSILVAANGVEERHFNLLSKAATSLMHIAMSMHIPIKGVIAQGLFSYDKESELYFGRPLVDAYLLHEEVKYYGIVVHNTAERTVKKYANANNPYSNTPVFIQKGSVSHYHLCWNLINQQLFPEDITDKCKEWIDMIAEDVSGEPRMYVDRTMKVLEQDRITFKVPEEHNEG